MNSLLTTKNARKNSIVANDRAVVLKREIHSILERYRYIYFLT